MAGGKKATQFVVTAPLVAATVGNTVLHFYKGDILPQGVSDGSLENLKSLGFVAAGDAPVGEDATGGKPADYASLKVDDLKAEIDKRNEGREEADLIPSDGKKEDLVKALEDDDSK